MRPTSLILVGVSLLLGLADRAVASPLDTLYLTDGDSGHLFIVQGNALTTVNTFVYGQGRQFAIAVQDTVRLQSAYDSQGGNQGAEYSLGGVFTGVNYTNNYGSELLDGTTDGYHNYTVQWPTGQIIQFDRNWASPSLLFTLPVANDDVIGITYDPVNNSLWLLDRRNAQILDYTLNGTFLSSFSILAGFGGDALALDPGDETLWTFNGFELVQWSRSGAELSTDSVAGLTGNILGAEFAERNAVVPEPSSVALLGIGTIVGAIVFWRRWTDRRSLIVRLPLSGRLASTGQSDNNVLHGGRAHH